MNIDGNTVKNEITRRQFVVRSAMAGAAMAMTGNHLAAAPKANARPICVFSKHLQWLDWGAAAELAAEAGLDGLDLAVRPRGHVLPENVSRDLPKAVKAVQAAGLICPMMTTAIVDASPASERLLKTAADLGIKYYRMGYLSYDEKLGVAGTLEKYKPQMAALAKLNEKLEIHGAYQNHAGTRIGGPVWDIWELIRDLDPRWIGCQYDIRHAVVEGGNSWPVTLKLLLPHIRCIVLKDFKWGEKNGRTSVVNTPLGEGIVDFSAYFKILNQAAFGGPISLHFEYEMPGAELGLAQRKRATLPILRRDTQRARAYAA